jgi:hypothetical protein
VRVNALSHLLSALGYAFIALGFWAGWAVAAHPKLEAFKVLNIIGLSYDLLGVLVLSELATQSERAKHFIVTRVALAVLQAQFLLPMGAALGAILHLGAPSATVAATLFMSVWAWSWLPLLLLEHVIVWPVLGPLNDLSLRSRSFGLLLLLAGGIIQLLAAFLDLRS